MRYPAISTDLRNRLAFWALVGVALLVAHDAIYLAQIGPGQALATALRTAGHGYWMWASLALTAVALVAGISFWLRMRRLRRRARALGARHDAPGSFARRFVVAWLRLGVVVAIGFTIQENVEHLIAHGHAPGAGRAARPRDPAGAAGHRPHHRGRGGDRRARGGRAGSARRRHRGGHCAGRCGHRSPVRDRPRGSWPPSVRSSPTPVPVAHLLPWSSQQPETNHEQGRVMRREPGRNHDPSHRTGGRLRDRTRRAHRRRGAGPRSRARSASTRSSSASSTSRCSPARRAGSSSSSRTAGRSPSKGWRRRSTPK